MTRSHSIFRGWQRQSPEYERKLTGNPVLTQEQLLALVRAGWSLWQNGVWESPGGTYHTEAEAKEWLSAPTPNEKPPVAAATTEGSHTETKSEPV